MINSTADLQKVDAVSELHVHGSMFGSVAEILSEEGVEVTVYGGEAPANKSSAQDVTMYIGKGGKFMKVNCFMLEGETLVPHLNRNGKFTFSLAGETWPDMNMLPATYMDSNPRPSFVGVLSNNKADAWLKWLVKKRCHIMTAMSHGETGRFVSSMFGAGIEPGNMCGSHSDGRAVLEYTTLNGVPSASIRIDTDGMEAYEVVELYKRIRETCTHLSTNNGDRS